MRGKYGKCLSFGCIYKTYYKITQEQYPVFTLDPILFTFIPNIKSYQIHYMRLTNHFWLQILEFYYIINAIKIWQCLHTMFIVIASLPQLMLFLLTGIYRCHLYYMDLNWRSWAKICQNCSGHSATNVILEQRNCKGRFHCEIAILECIRSLNSIYCGLNKAEGLLYSVH